MSMAGRNLSHSLRRWVVIAYRASRHSALARYLHGMISHPADVLQLGPVPAISDAGLDLWVSSRRGC
ncbi:hypothetical protein [Streptomyces erythrochromogenes]|uniref:hypothetical protein n=1 Tax=Streptomyces erythrochromogenes TaxID=285574 RepID=UPI00382C0A6D|nr:hypothetical protein OG489_34075 [Streptomyces erythrochromogenes]